jgi:hypothetical protein
MALEKKWESLMKVEESIIINRSRKMCSHSWRPVPNDPVWMESVVESVWLVPVSSDTEAPIEWGRRGRIVMKSMGRRLECIDEVIDYPAWQTNRASDGRGADKSQYGLHYRAGG